MQLFLEKEQQGGGERPDNTNSFRALPKLKP
jgi:hypothetical protein